MKYWLFKTEPISYSIDDLQKEKKTLWTGIRNYQVRNFLRDDIKKGDKVLIYHSSCDLIGVVGVAEVTNNAQPDPTAQDENDHHYDPKATKENPIWYCVEIKFVTKFKSILGMKDLRENQGLSGMKLLQKGSRLSVTPVTKQEFEIILKKTS